MSPPCIYVLVLNWNGWPLTLRCLESVLRAPPTPRYRVVVWDNGSSDASAARIAEWAAGARSGEMPGLPPALQRCVAPALPKPIACSVLGETDLDTTQTPLTVIRSTRNLGYAGGNNGLLRYALAQPDCSGVWILNNDVVVDPDCLAALEAAHRSDRFDRPLGTAIYDLNQPDQLQAWGGQHLGHGWLVAPRHIRRIGQPPDFLIGASLFLSATRARQLGKFNEAYFLNAEDLEYTYHYAQRFRAQYPDESAFLVAGRIWHQESSTQSRSRQTHAYYFTRNLLYAARRIGTAQAWTTLVYACARVVWNLVRGRPAAARGTLRGLAHFLRGIEGPLPP